MRIELNRAQFCEWWSRGFSALVLACIFISLQACDIIAKREPNVDPKPDMSSEREAAEKDRQPPMSLLASSIETESPTVQVGSQIGVTLTVKDTKGQVMTSVTGATVSFLFLGGGSLGTFDSVTDNGDGTYSTKLLGGNSGSASRIIASVNGSILLTNPTVTVTAGAATKVVIEDAADGSGSAIGALTITDGTPLTLYAVSRDIGNNYAGPADVTWSESGGTGTLSATTGSVTVFTPNQGTGTTVITADHASLVDDTTGTITLAWSVTSLSNLLVWLKADALNLTDGDDIPSWTDLSGGARHAVQGVLAKRPLWKQSSSANSMPTVLFDGTDDHLTIPHAVALNTNSMSLFAVIKTLSSINYATIASKTSSNSYNDGWSFGELGGTGTTFGFFVNDITTHKSTASITISEYKYLSAVYDQSTVKFWVDGVQGTSASYSSAISGSAEDLYIGDFVGNGSCITGCFNGEISEFVMYGAGVNNTQRQTIEAYLKTKYGL